MKTRILIISLIFITNLNSIYADEWMAFPWSMRTENNLRIESIPYQINQGGDWGITKVYKKKTLLYSIEEYFSNFIILNKTGEYFVSIDFSLWRKDYNITLVDDKGIPLPKVNEEFNGKAIRIYRNGKFQKSFDFTDFSIDTSKLIKNGDHFYWGSVNKLLSNCPVLIKDDTLIIFSIDNKILTFCLNSSEPIKTGQLEDTQVKIYSKILPKQKYEIKIPKRLPDDFCLPKMSDGRIVEECLADFLNLKPADNESDSAILEIYVHRLLITREGSCEKCWINATERKDINKDFGYEYNFELGEKIETWLCQQKFKSKLIPKYTDKYVFREFLYFKKK